MSPARLQALRHDNYVPTHCQPIKLSHFYGGSIEYFTYGSREAEKSGFDHSYPLWPEQLKKLFVGLGNYHRGEIRQHWQDPEMTEAWQILIDSYHDMGFPVEVYGEILEMFAEVDLSYSWTAQDYFVTGSIAYHGGSKLKGELDLVVSRRDNCRVMAVGEVKIGRQRLGKAHLQLRRFKEFLSHQGFQGEELLLFNPFMVTSDYVPAANNYR